MNGLAAARNRLVALVLMLALATLPSLAGTDAWWAAEDDPAMASLGDLAEVEAVTFDRAGGFAAAAFQDPQRGKRSFVRLTVRGETRATDDVTMPARVRSLLYVGGLDSLYVIAQRAGKERPLETYLVSVQVDDLKATRNINLPHSSRGMDIWAREGSLVVAATNEIRTFQLPGFRSGPLYRVPGENLAILNLSGTNRFLIGRAEGIVMVDFDDTPGRDGMPVREQVATDSAVMEIAPLPDGRVSILLADGGTRSLWTDPLRTTAEKPAPPPPPPVAVTPVPEATATAAAAASAVAVEPQATADAPPEPAVEPEPAEPPPPAPAAVAATATAAAAATAPEEERQAEERAPVEAPDGADLYGRLSGAARTEVRWVVLQGPDNLLKEAARVEPDDDGVWSCGDLAPGTYRVVLDAGGSRIVQSTPSFRVVRIEPDGAAIEVETIEVLRVR